MNQKTLLIITIVVAILFVISLTFNIIQNTKIAKAESFAQTVSSYLIQTQKQCQYDYTNLSGMNSCLNTLIAQLSQKPNLVEAMFVNFYMPQQAKGTLILKNIGMDNYDATKFKLYLNTKLQDNDGCEIGKTLDPNEVCSLDFKEYCKPGDTLFVEYEGKTLFAKAC